MALTLLLAGCAPGATASPTTTPTRTVPTPTATPLPTDEPTSTPKGDASPSPARLIAHRVSAPPAIDGDVDGAWASAQPLHASLSWGMDGPEHALDVELRALQAGDSLYLLARWPGDPPAGEQDTVSNQFTFHWRIPDAAAQGLDCEVACHTAHADGSGHIAYANAETIPQGGSAALEAAGGWKEGTWTLEWGRPLRNGNPFDLQFGDLEASYPFLVKVFRRVEGRPDPVSGRYNLVFGP